MLIRNPTGSFWKSDLVLCSWIVTHPGRPCIRGEEASTQPMPPGLGLGCQLKRTTYCLGSGRQGRKSRDLQRERTFFTSLVMWGMDPSLCWFISSFVFHDIMAWDGNIYMYIYLRNRIDLFSSYIDRICRAGKFHFTSLFCLGLGAHSLHSHSHPFSVAAPPPHKSWRNIMWSFFFSSLLSQWKPRTSATHLELTCTDAPPPLPHFPTRCWVNFGRKICALFTYMYRKGEDKFG